MSPMRSGPLGLSVPRALVRGIGTIREDALFFWDTPSGPQPKFGFENPCSTEGRISERKFGKSTRFHREKALSPSGENKEASEAYRSTLKDMLTPAQYRLNVLSPAATPHEHRFHFSSIRTTQTRERSLTCLKNEAGLKSLSERRAGACRCKCSRPPGSIPTYWTNRRSAAGMISVLPRSSFLRPATAGEASSRCWE